MMILTVSTAALPLLWSCTKDVEPSTPVASGEGSVVTFNFTSSQPDIITRRVDEDAMSDIQLLLIGVDGTRYYFNPRDVRSFRTKIRRGVYDVYAVANYNRSIENYWGPDFYFDSAYAYYSKSDKYLVMSFRGRADFSAVEPPAYSVPLVRTVAKLRFTINQAPGVKITRMTLNRVPAATALMPGGSRGTNFSDGVEVAAQGGSFTVYIPENCQGTVPSITDQRQRTYENSPQGATWLKIEGELTGKIRHFESAVYLGSNTAGDFNIRRNCDYRIEINIRSDMTNDYRIEVSPVGHEVIAHLTPDGKYLASRSGNTLNPFFITDGTNKNAKVQYRYIFECKSPDKIVINGRLLDGNTYSGTLTAGETHSLMFFYNVAIFTPDDHSVKYTLVFTDEYGATTTYTGGEFRYANMMYVFVPKAGLAPKADVSFTPDTAVIYDGQITDSYYYTAYYPDVSIELGIKARLGYTFKGWYSSISYEELFSSSPTYSYHFPEGVGSICAKVE